MPEHVGSFGTCSRTVMSDRSRPMAWLETSNSVAAKGLSVTCGVSMTLGQTTATGPENPELRAVSEGYGLCKERRVLK